jgi:hypothetical protein
MAGAANYMYEKASFKGVGYKNAEMIIPHRLALTARISLFLSLSKGCILLWATGPWTNTKWRLPQIPLLNFLSTI